MKLVKMILLITLFTSFQSAMAQPVIDPNAYAAFLRGNSYGYNPAMLNTGTNTSAWQKFKDGCPTTCVLAAMAAVMVVQSLAAAKKAKGVGDEMSCAKTNSCFNDSGGGPGNPYNPNNPTLNPNNPGDRALVEFERQRPEIERFLSQREKEGYKIDKKTGTVTDPSGKTYGSASDAMQSMTPQQRAEADKILAEAAKAGESLLKQLEEYDEEYGGGGGSSVAAGGYNSVAGNNGIKIPTNANRNQASVAGLSVNHGGDRIGVSGDNIFDMIHRRYETTKPGMNQNPTGP